MGKVARRPKSRDNWFDSEKGFSFHGIIRYDTIGTQSLAVQLGG